MLSLDRTRLFRAGVAGLALVLVATLMVVLGPAHGRSAAVTAPALNGTLVAAPTAPRASATRTPERAWRKPGLYNGLNTSKRVVLSYDDCPTSLQHFKKTVLAAKRAGVGLVFFPTGTCLRGGTFDATFARRHGMYVGNHSVHHRDLTRLGYQGVIAELGSQQTSFARPPFGAFNATVRRALRAKGMHLWLWDVDTNDWRGKNQSQVVSWAVSHSRRGSTVLMHMQHAGFNPSAIAQIKQGLAKRGLKVCRPYPGTTPAKPRRVSC